jgi:tight adherence protein B
MIMNNLMIGATFLAVFCGVFGFNLLVSDILDRSRKRRLKELETEMLARQKDRARDTVKSFESSALGKLMQAAESDQLDQRQTFRQKFDAMLEQADMDLSMGKVVGAAMLLATSAAVIVFLCTQNLVYGFLAAMLAFSVPFLYVSYRRNQRADAIRGQLPDSLELMSRVLRAGQTITQAMHVVANEFSAPISSEFALCYEQQNLGLSTDMALRDLARRTRILEIQIFVLALIIHRQSGGNLTELLDRLATLIRQRYRMRGKIRTLTAEGRIQALILLGLPVFMYVLLLFISREYALELLQHSGLIAGALLMMGIGAVWIRRIINFDF